MDVARRLNAALRATTGYELTRVPPPKQAAPTTTPTAAEGRFGRAEGKTTRRQPGGLTKVAKELVRPPADPKVDRLLSQPVFVLCPIRSGSTLLRLLLNAHSQLHAPHELHLRRLFVQFQTDLCEEAMGALGHNRADLEHLLWDRVLHRELVRSGKQTVVDKTPGNVFAHERIATCWPDARFIFLLRHPMSIVQSWADAEGSGRDVDAAVAHTLKFMEALQRARTRLDGLTVRYEDLVSDPARETGRACEFLGLQWEPTMLEYGQREGVLLTKGLGDWRDKIRSGNVQEGRAIPTAEEVHPALRDISATWGYTS